jgi:hypothetical protein
MRVPWARHEREAHDWRPRRGHPLGTRGHCGTRKTKCRFARPKRTNTTDGLFGQILATFGVSPCSPAIFQIAVAMTAAACLLLVHLARSMSLSEHPHHDR